MKAAIGDDGAWRAIPARLSLSIPRRITAGSSSPSGKAGWRDARITLAGRAALADPRADVNRQDGLDVMCRPQHLPAYTYRRVAKWR